jgi:hypothetical protein
MAPMVSNQPLTVEAGFKARSIHLGFVVGKVAL